MNLKPAQKFENKNLNYAPKPGVTRDRGNASKLVLTAGKPKGKTIGGASLPAASLPVPTNTPSLKREKGQDVNVNIVPTGSSVWGQSAAPGQTTEKEEENVIIKPSNSISKPAPWSKPTTANEGDTAKSTTVKSSTKSSWAADADSDEEEVKQQQQLPVPPVAKDELSWRAPRVEDPSISFVTHREESFQYNDSRKYQNGPVGTRGDGYYRNNSNNSNEMFRNESRYNREDVRYNRDNKMEDGNRGNRRISGFDGYNMNQPPQFNNTRRNYNQQTPNEEEANRVRSGSGSNFGTSSHYDNNYSQYSNNRVNSNFKFSNGGPNFNGDSFPQNGRNFSSYSANANPVVVTAPSNANEYEGDQHMIEATRQEVDYLEQTRLARVHGTAPPARPPPPVSFNNNLSPSVNVSHDQSSFQTNRNEYRADGFDSNNRQTVDRDRPSRHLNSNDNSMGTRQHNAYEPANSRADEITWARVKRPPDDPPPPRTNEPIKVPYRPPVPQSNHRDARDNNRDHISELRDKDNRPRRTPRDFSGQDQQDFSESVEDSFSSLNIKPVEPKPEVVKKVLSRQEDDKEKVATTNTPVTTVTSTHPIPSNQQAQPAPVQSTEGYKVLAVKKAPVTNENAVSSTTVEAKQTAALAPPVPLTKSFASLFPNSNINQNNTTNNDTSQHESNNSNEIKASNNIETISDLNNQQSNSTATARPVHYNSVESHTSSNQQDVDTNDFGPASRRKVLYDPNSNQFVDSSQLTSDVKSGSRKKNGPNANNLNESNQSKPPRTSNHHVEKEIENNSTSNNRWEKKFLPPSKKRVTSQDQADVEESTDVVDNDLKNSNDRARSNQVDHNSNSRSTKHSEKQARKKRSEHNDNDDDSEKEEGHKITKDYLEKSEFEAIMQAKKEARTKERLTRGPRTAGLLFRHHEEGGIVRVLSEQEAVAKRSENRWQTGSNQQIKSKHHEQHDYENPTFIIKTRPQSNHESVESATAKHSFQAPTTSTDNADADVESFPDDSRSSKQKSAWKEREPRKERKPRDAKFDPKRSKDRPRRDKNDNLAFPTSELLDGPPPLIHKSVLTTGLTAAQAEPLGEFSLSKPLTSLSSGNSADLDIKKMAAETDANRSYQQITEFIPGVGLSNTAVSRMAWAQGTNSSSGSHLIQQPQQNPNAEMDHSLSVPQSNNSSSGVGYGAHSGLGGILLGADATSNQSWVYSYGGGHNNSDPNYYSATNYLHGDGTSDGPFLGTASDLGRPASYSPFSGISSPLSSSVLRSEAGVAQDLIGDSRTNATPLEGQRPPRGGRNSRGGRSRDINTSGRSAGGKSSERFYNARSKHTIEVSSNEPLDDQVLLTVDHTVGDVENEVTTGNRPTGPKHGRGGRGRGRGEGRSSSGSGRGRSSGRGRGFSGPPAEPA
eukprot:gene9440-12720_t